MAVGPARDLALLLQQQQQLPVITYHCKRFHTEWILKY